MFGYIYLVTNLINGREYIGQRRWENEETIHSDEYVGSGLILKQALKKYGRDCIQKEILCICETKEMLDEMEKCYIVLFDACKNPRFYNIHEGGTGGNTRKGYTPEQTRKFIEKCRKSHTGKHVSPETKEKISRAMQGVNNHNHRSRLTESQLKQKSERVKGERNPMFGKKMPPESIERMRRKLIGRPSPNRGKIMSAEQKQKISEACRKMWADQEKRELWISRRIGQKRSLEARENLSKGAYRRYGTIPMDESVVINQYDKTGKLIHTFHGIHEYYDFFHVKTCRNLKTAIKEHTLFRNSYWELGGPSTIETTI